MPECRIIDAVRFNEDQRRTRNALKDGDHVVLSVEVADRLIGLDIVELTTEARAARERKTQKKETPVLTVAGFSNPLVEIVFDGEKTRFVQLDVGGQPEYLDELEIGEAIYQPIMSEAVKRGAVLLPKEAIEYKSTEQLVADIESFIRRYLDVSPDFQKFAAYYVLLSWVYDRLNTVPYLRLLGDFSSGKSRGLDTIGGLCYRPTIIAGSATPAPMYRLQSVWHGTIVVDEGDRKRSDQADEVTKILNCGFERGKPVLRCNADDPNDVEVHDPFGPKVIGSRFPFYDQALESRCLTENMRPTRRRDIPVVLPPAFYDEQEHLRGQLLMFRLRNFSRIDPNVIQGLDLGRVENRIKQAVSGFGVLLANDPALLEKFRVFVHTYQTQLIETRSLSFDGLLVGKLFELRESDDRHNLTAKGLIGLIDDLPEKTSPATVGRHLKALGIQTRQVKTDGKNSRILIWESERLEPLFERYVPDYRGRPATAVTAVTAVTTETGPNKVTEVTEVTGVAGTPWGRSATAETTETKTGHSEGSVSEVSAVSGVSGEAVAPKSITDWGLAPDSSPVEPAPDGPDRHAGQRNRQTGVVPRA